MPEYVFINQYPEYAGLLNDIKLLKQYLPDINMADLEIFVENPKSVQQMTTFFVQGGLKFHLRLQHGGVYKIQ